MGVFLHQHFKAVVCAFGPCTPKHVLFSFRGRLGLRKLTLRRAPPRMPRLYGKFAFECKIWKSSWKMFMVVIRRGLYFPIEHSDSFGSVFKNSHV